MTTSTKFVFCQPDNSYFESIVPAAQVIDLVLVVLLYK